MPMNPAPRTPHPPPLRLLERPALRVPRSTPRPATPPRGPLQWLALWWRTVG